MKLTVGNWLLIAGCWLLAPVAASAGEITFHSPECEVYDPASRTWSTHLPDASRKVVVAFLGEGFRGTDLSDYQAITTAYADKLLHQQPFEDCIADFLVVRINVLSQSEGIGDSNYFYDKVNQDPFLGGVLSPLPAPEMELDTPFDLCFYKKRTFGLRPGKENGPRNASGEDTYALALERIPGFRSVGTLVPVILVNELEAEHPSIVSRYASDFPSPWPPAIIMIENPMVLIHELGHAFGKLHDEYYGASFGLFYDFLRRKDFPLPPMIPDDSILGANLTWYEDIDDPDHRWFGYKGVWGIRATVQHEAAFGDWKWTLYKPGVNCLMWNQNETPEFCPICLRGLREKVDGFAGRAHNRAPVLGDVGFDSLTGTKVAITGNETVLNLKAFQPFRFSMTAEDSDPERTGQPHSVRFYILLSDVSNMDCEWSPYLPFEPSYPYGSVAMTITKRGQAVTGWLTRQGGGGFVFTSSDAEWSGQNLTYPCTGGFSGRIWVFDSGGLISEPRTFRVVVE